jgi:UDP-3-O-[3-hydroxymyristoyl] N-acetylglucosamine deacetylase
MATVADCRTFTRLAEIGQLRALGLAKGGGLHNAVVVDGARVLNPEGLRRPDEFVRHKALDAVGDLALAGGPVLGVYRGDKAGHGLTNALLRALFATPGAWAWEPATDRPEAAEPEDRRDLPAPIAAE